jgi:hypothetical protein
VSVIGPAGLAPAAVSVEVKLRPSSEIGAGFPTGVETWARIVYGVHARTVAGAVSLTVASNAGVIGDDGVNAHVTGTTTVVVTGAALAGAATIATVPAAARPTADESASSLYGMVLSNSWVRRSWAPLAIPRTGSRTGVTRSWSNHDRPPSRSPEPSASGSAPFTVR